MTRPEPCAPKATGLPARSAMRLSGLSARTTNSPGVEYIAVMTLRFEEGRPIPAKASWAASPCTSAMSSRPSSRSGMFSALPLVFFASTTSEGSASRTVSDEGRPVDREAAAGRRGAEREAGFLGHGGGFQLGLGNGGSDRHDGENHRHNDNEARSDHHQ